MKTIGSWLVMSVLLMSVVGCSQPGKTANAGLGVNVSNVPGETANTAKTNVEELELLVNIPYETDDVVWKEDAARKKVVAVLHFSKSDADKIVADGAAHQPPQHVRLPSESWYPAELIAQSEMSGGEEGLQGIAYAADGFFMEPYTSGRIVRITDTDYFVLQLAAK